MINATDTFNNTMISSVNEVYIKIDLLNKNENVLKVIEHHVNSTDIGDISVDGDRDIQRMFTLTLDNANGEFTWAENALIWADLKRVKIYIGLRTPVGIEYVPQGVFIITEPEAKHTLQTNTVTISGQDKWYLLTGNFGRFDHETTINKNTTIKEAIRILLQGAGITQMILDECNITLPYSFTYQIGQNRGEAIKDLCAKAFIDGQFFYSVYFDVNGYFRFEKFKDPTLEASAWQYKIEKNTLYAGSSRKLNDSTLYNHIYVFGGNSQTASFRSELAIDETNPGNYPESAFAFSIQKIGDRKYFWNDGNPDSNIDTQSQCDARAKYELRKQLQYSEEISFDLAPNYLHEVNDIINIEDPYNGCTGNYQLKRFIIPIKPKIVTASAIKVREVL